MVGQIELGMYIVVNKRSNLQVDMARVTRLDSNKYTVIRNGIEWILDELNGKWRTENRFGVKYRHIEVPTLWCANILIIVICTYEDLLRYYVMKI